MSRFQQSFFVIYLPFFLLFFAISSPYLYLGCYE